MPETCIWEVMIPLFLNVCLQRKRSAQTFSIPYSIICGNQDRPILLVITQGSQHSEDLVYLFLFSLLTFSSQLYQWLSVKGSNGRRFNIRIRMHFIHQMCTSTQKIWYSFYTKKRNQEKRHLWTVARFKVQGRRGGTGKRTT